MNTKEHKLTIMAEECNEVAHRISKILRFGHAEIQRGQGRTNMERLEEEFVQLLATAELVGEEFGVDLLAGSAEQRQRVDNKKAAVARYMAYSKTCGCLSDEIITTGERPPPRLHFLDPDFRPDPKTKFHCCVCQKDITSTNHNTFVYLTDDWSSAVHPSDPHSGELWPVGSKCAKKIPSEFIVLSK